MNISRFYRALFKLFKSIKVYFQILFPFKAHTLFNKKVLLESLLASKHS